MQLTWANQIRMHTNNPVLVLTPLAVGPQTVQEGEKFGIECIRSKEGKSYPITVTNYERLHYYNPSDFAGVVLDESSILKNFAGEYRKRITEFLKKVKYRLLATATAAPNDYFELGTSSEALGYMGFVDMLGRFFVNNNNNCAQKRMYGEAPHFRLKGHAQTPFWQWVASWSIALRKPSDMGYDDGGFNLPDLKEARHVITARKLADGHLFNLPANNLIEQRDETRRTIEDRCERAAELVNNTGEPAVIWCHLNNEGDLLEKLIPDAIQVAGKDKDDAKEEKLLKFANNQERVLITKPKIGAWGLNLQHCNHVVYFPSHSYESYYQAIRRCYRFGQKRPVTVDLVMSEGQLKIMDNLQRKSEQADRMFDSLISEMHSAVSIEKVNRHTQQMEAPTWL
ncbi:MAG: DEAD/DEAH box helicase [Proteobacteria bacterium]|nr:DEAD/DEAH box helicase [Pseudomonadota bacterium]